MFIYVCVGLVVFLKSISSLAFLLSFTPLLCGTGRLWLPLPIRHARTELSDFGRTFIVTICTIYRSGLISFIVFLWKNNPNSLYNALTREFPLLYAI